MVALKLSRVMETDRQTDRGRGPEKKRNLFESISNCKLP